MRRTESAAFGRSAAVDIAQVRRYPALPAGERWIGDAGAWWLLCGHAGSQRRCFPRIFVTEKG